MRKALCSLDEKGSEMPLTPELSEAKCRNQKATVQSKTVIINKNVSLKNVMAQDLCSFLMDKLF